MSRLAGQAARGEALPLPGVMHDMANVVAALRQMSQVRSVQAPHNAGAVSLVVVLGCLRQVPQLITVQARHIGKVVVRNTSSLQQLQCVDGTVMVVGGTGTLGN
jgi:hypothetical protein